MAKITCMSDFKAKKELDKYEEVEGPLAPHLRQISTAIHLVKQTILNSKDYTHEQKNHLLIELANSIQHDINEVREWIM